MIEYKQINTTSYTLTGEGAGIVKNGSHEYRVWEVLPPAGGSPMAIPDLQVGHFSHHPPGGCVDEADSHRNWSEGTLLRWDRARH